MLKTRRKTLVLGLVGIAFILWAVGGTLWYTNVFMNKERRFWAAIGNGLRTTSVTKEITQDTPNGSSVQLSRMNFGALPFAESKTSVYNRTSTVTSSTIVTRTLTTPTDSYVQYEKIATDEKKEDGSAFDFSNVVNTWAKRTDEDAGTDERRNQMSENFIQLVPLANLSASSANDFVNRLKATNAYEVDFKTATEDSDNDLTVFDVTVNAKAYVAVLSEIFKEAGFGELSALDASAYDETSTIKIKLAIDGGNNVRKIAFSDSEFESYVDYGASTQLKIPENPVSFTDLQSRLQSVR